MSHTPDAQPIVVETPTAASTNSLAIVSLVTSVIGLGVVGVITGHIGLSQMRRTQEQGRGLALAGLIVGYVSIAAGLLALIGAVLYGLLFVGALSAFRS
jgi:hypothetical protein